MRIAALCRLTAAQAVAAAAGVMRGSIHARSAATRAAAGSAAQSVTEAAVDSNVPSNPAYHFRKVVASRPVAAGWAERPGLVAAAGASTQCVHAGAQPDVAFGSVVPPLYNTSTFAFSDICTNAG